MLHSTVGPPLLQFRAYTASWQNASFSRCHVALGMHFDPLFQRCVYGMESFQNEQETAPFERNDLLQSVVAISFTRYEFTLLKHLRERRGVHIDRIG